MQLLDGAFRNYKFGEHSDEALTGGARRESGHSDEGLGTDCHPESTRRACNKPSGFVGGAGLSVVEDMWICRRRAAAASNRR
mmetsp:Transcript_24508/g.43621  ORF Transcript_24508/g.43621 Transcript_24508/m.43621 type:complete len:82 (+) Transcript_24508:77-322(+)